MQISVTFRHIEPSEALKNYVTDRLSKFKRYLDGPVEAHVVLGLEKFRHLADVTIDSNGRIIKGKEENTDMYAAIDLVMDKIDMQLKKFRDKMRSDKGDRSRSAASPGGGRGRAGLPPGAPQAGRGAGPAADRCRGTDAKRQGSPAGLYRRGQRRLEHLVPTPGRQLCPGGTGFGIEGSGNHENHRALGPRIVSCRTCRPPTRRGRWRNWPRPWRRGPMGCSSKR